MRISLRVLVVPVISSLFLAAVPLGSSLAFAGSDISVSQAGFSGSADRSGYGPLDVDWLNTGITPITLAADDSSWSLTIDAGKEGDRTFTATSGTTVSPYHLQGGATGDKGTITVFPGLSKGSVTSTSASFSWGAATGATSYTVKRDANSIATQAGTSYTDSGLAPSTTYVYSISTSTYASQTLSITTLPQAPTQLTATVSGSNAVLTWTAGQSTNVSGYQVYLDGTQLGSTDAQTLRFTASGLKAGTSYSYSVRTLDKSGQTSGDSNTAIVLIASNGTPIPTATPKPVATPTPTPLDTPLPEATPTPTTGTPVLTKITVDGQAFTPSPTDVLKLTVGKILHLEGTTTPNTNLQIGVYSQKQTYDITSDSTGAWKVDVATADLEVGSHQVTAALKDKSGQLGTETSLLQFNLVSATPASTTSSTSDNTTWTYLKWVALGVIILALIGLCVSAFALIRQRRLAKRAKLAGPVTSPVIATRTTPSIDKPTESDHEDKPEEAPEEPIVIKE